MAENQSDSRDTLTGIAAQLVAEMECDNGCRFYVSERQALRLNVLCGREPMLSMVLSHLATLASGEHTEQQSILDAYRNDGNTDADEVYANLIDIFDGTEQPDD